MLGIAQTFFDSEQNIWSGPKRKDFYGPDVTLGEAALFALSKCPSKIVQVMDSTGEQITAETLIRRSQAVARNFMRMGLQTGDVIGISAYNSINLSAVTIGAFLCGTPTNALYPGFDIDSAAGIFKITKPKLLFCEAENYKIMEEVVRACDLNASIYLLKGAIPGVPNASELFVDEAKQNIAEYTSFPCSKLSGDDTAVILCSSGTTGNPKGVMCSHKSLLYSQVFPQLTVDNVLFTFSTMYWASGIWTFLASILNATKLVLTDAPATADNFFRLVETHKISHFLCGPHIIAEVLSNCKRSDKERLASIDTILCGGSKVPLKLAQDMNSFLGDAPRNGFVVTYGLSELSSMLSQNDGGPPKRSEGTEGRLMPNMQVRIVDESGNSLGVNSTGILHILPPHPWRGYYRDPEATERTLKNGWLVTGDIGYFDDIGFLHICTRDSDIFKSNNFQIYPQQIEEIIMHVPGVLEVCVFGVPDYAATNLTACAIVRAANDAGANLKANQVVAEVEDKLSSVYHLKEGVFFVNELPKTGSGKVLRRRVWSLINTQT